MICKNCHRAVDWLNVGHGFRVLVHTNSGAVRCAFGWGVTGRNAQLDKQPVPLHRERILLGQLIAKYPAEARRILRQITQDSPASSLPPSARSEGSGVEAGGGDAATTHPASPPPAPTAKVLR